MTGCAILWKDRAMRSRRDDWQPKQFEEIPCPDAETARRTAEGRQAAETEVGAEWIYLRSDGRTRWVARRIPPERETGRRRPEKSSFLDEFVESLFDPDSWFP